MASQPTGTGADKRTAAGYGMQPPAARRHDARSGRRLWQLAHLGPIARQPSCSGNRPALALSRGSIRRERRRRGTASNMTPRERRSIGCLDLEAATYVSSRFFGTVGKGRKLAAGKWTGGNGLFRHKILIFALTAAIVTDIGLLIVLLPGGLAADFGVYF